MLELISIITPMYNSNDFVENTIKSIQAQTYQNWELIIIDDASTDGSAKIAESFATKDERSLYKKQPCRAGGLYVLANLCKVEFVIRISRSVFPGCFVYPPTPAAVERVGQPQYPILLSSLCFPPYHHIDIHKPPFGR